MHCLGSIPFNSYRNPPTRLNTRCRTQLGDVILVDSELMTSQLFFAVLIRIRSLCFRKYFLCSLASICFIAGNRSAFSAVAEVQEQLTLRFIPSESQADCARQFPWLLYRWKMCAQFRGRNSCNDQLCYLRILEVLISGWSLCVITAIEMCVTCGMIQHDVRSSKWNFSFHYAYVHRMASYGIYFFVNVDAT